MKLLNWFPCVRPPQVKEAESPECYVIQATDPASTHNTIKRVSPSSYSKQHYFPDLNSTRERAVWNSSLFTSAVGHAESQGSRCPPLACAIFRILSPHMLSIMRHLDDPMLATLMELSVDVPSDWRTTGDACTAGHGGNNASGTRLCLCLASFCKGNDSTKTTAKSSDHLISEGELMLALMELSPSLKKGIEIQAKHMASRATTEHQWPAVGELEQCEHLVKGSHSFLVSSCYFRDRATGSFQPSIVVEISSQHLKEHSHLFATLPHIITSAAHHMASQHVGDESSLTEKEEHSDLMPVNKNSDDDDHCFARLHGFAEGFGDGPSIDGPYTERPPATPRLGRPLPMTSCCGLTSILDALPMMATMMDASGTIVLYKNKEAREYWDNVGRTQTAGMENQESTTPAKVIMSLLFKDEVGTVCNAIAKGQKWKGLLPVPRSPPCNSVSLSAAENLTIGSGRLSNSSDDIPIPPRRMSTCRTEASLESEIQEESDGDVALEIRKSDPTYSSSRLSLPFSSSVFHSNIPPTISKSFSTKFLGNHTPQGLSTDPLQRQSCQHRSFKENHSLKLPKSMSEVMRRRSMLSASGFDEFSDYAASLADPKGARSSNTDTFSDASMGFRFSSRLLSIMHPASDQQSNGSGDCPSSSSRLHSFSQVADNTLRRKSLCFPPAWRMDLMPKSADSQAIPNVGDISSPLMMPDEGRLSAVSTKALTRSAGSADTQEVDDVSPTVQPDEGRPSAVSTKVLTRSAGSTGNQEVNDVVSPTVQPDEGRLSAVSTKVLTRRAESRAIQVVGDVVPPTVQPDKRGHSIVYPKPVTRSAGSTGTQQDASFLTSGGHEFGGPAYEDTDWHDVIVLPVCMPSMCKQGMLLLQTDVSRRTELEMRLTAVTEAQLDMLESMLPRHVLESVVNPQLSTYDLTQMARSHSNVTIMFMDIVGFTAMCKAVSPQAVMGYLNELFTWMDTLVDKYGIFKVDTCGDGYIVAGGLMKADEHGLNCLDEDADYGEAARQVIRFTEELMRSVPLLPYPHTMEPAAVRVGIHTGSCVSGLIGTKLCKFSLWGDTMNTASRMESTSKPGSVQISEATMALLESSQKDKFVPSGGVEVKGRGLMQTYLWDFDELVDAESVVEPTAIGSLRCYHSEANLMHCEAGPSFQFSDRHTSPHLPSTENNVTGCGVTGWLPGSTSTDLDGVALSNDFRGLGTSGDDLKKRRSHPSDSFARWLQAYQMSQHEKGKGKRVKHQAVYKKSTSTVS